MCSVIQSKKPASRRQPTTSIIENSSTSVPKSIECSACSALTTPKATISTAPMMAMPGRSIFIPETCPARRRVTGREDERSPAAICQWANGSDGKGMGTAANRARGMLD